MCADELYPLGTPSQYHYTVEQVQNIIITIAVTMYSHRNLQTLYCNNNNNNQARTRNRIGTRRAGGFQCVGTDDLQFSGRVEKRKFMDAGIIVERDGVDARGVRRFRDATTRDLLCRRLGVSYTHCRAVLHFARSRAKLI